jgi:PAS domain S-box-containing protein
MRSGNLAIMQPARIMIVEDEVITAQDIRLSLERCGYSVSALATTGEEALSKAEHDRPDLILVDVMLDGRMDGIDVAQAITARLPIPVIYLTAHSDETMLQRAKATAPYGYLLKPFNEQELYSSIEIALFKAGMEAKLRASEERFRVFADYTYDWETWRRPDGCYIYVSPSCERISGYRPEEFYQDPMLLESITHPDDRRLVDEHMETARTSQRPGTLDFRILTKGGGLRWISHDCQPVYDVAGTWLGTRGSNRDIDNRKQAEQALRVAHAVLEQKVRERTAEIEAINRQLRRLTSEVVLSEERERRRIATGLHDRIGQNLVLAKFRLSALREALATAQPVDTLEEIIALIDQSLQETRSLTFELSPPVLYELGLEAAIEWLLENIQQQGLQTRLEHDREPKPLEQSVQVILFQATRELLFNIMKHARATSVTVSIRRDQHSICISIQDDGIGFDCSKHGGKTSRGGGFGLMSIRERMTHLGGRFELESGPGQGTRASLFAPLQPEGRS